MKKRPRIALPLLLLTGAIIAPSFSNVNQIKTVHAVDASKYDYSKCNVNIPTDYYSTVDLNQNYEDFSNTLSTIITANYKNWSYDYVGKTILHYSDMDPENPDNVKCLYTGQSLTGGWNREHVWCKSHGFKSDTSALPYTDAHHLRVTNATANSTRNNSDYGEVSDLNYKIDMFGNKYTSSVYEPRDEVKGDCARMIFYIAIRYKNVDPYFANIIDGSSMSLTVDKGQAVFGNLKTLLKWHYQDPVSIDELYRNNVVYGYQKNRNPFIDHPEYVEKCWDVSSIQGYNVSTTVNADNISNLNYAVQHLPNTITINDEGSVNSSLNLYKALNNKEKATVNTDIYNKLMNSVKALRQIKLDKQNGEFIKTTYFKDADLSSTGYQRDKTIDFNYGSIFFSGICWEKSCDTNQLSLGYNNATSNTALNDFSFKKYSAGEYFKTNYEYQDMSSINIFCPAPKKDISSFKGYDLFIEQNGAYTVLKSNTVFDINIDYTFETPSTGKIGLIIYGAQTAICLQSLTVTLNDLDQNIKDLQVIQTKASLSFNYNVTTETSATFQSEKVNLSTTDDNAELFNFSSNLSVVFDRNGNNSTSNIENGILKLYKNGILKFTSRYPILGVSITTSGGSSYSVNTYGQISLDGENYSPISDCANITINNDEFYLKATEQIRFSEITIEYANIHDAALRFGLLIEKDVITNIMANHDVTGYGVFVAKTSALGTSSIKGILEDNQKDYSSETDLFNKLNQLGINTSVKERGATENDLVFHYTSDNGTTITDEGDSIIFRAYLPVPNAQFKTSISAAAYFVIDGKYVVLGQRDESVVSQAQKYTGYTGDLGDTLDYLSNL